MDGHRAARAVGRGWSGVAVPASAVRGGASGVAVGRASGVAVAGWGGSRARAGWGMRYSVAAARDVAQFGSALDWGSRGRRFESGRPDRVDQARFKIVPGPR